MAYMAVVLYPISLADLVENILNLKVWVSAIGPGYGNEGMSPSFQTASLSWCQHATIRVRDTSRGSILHQELQKRNLSDAFV